MRPPDIASVRDFPNGAPLVGLHLRAWLGRGGLERDSSLLIRAHGQHERSPSRLAGGRDDARPAAGSRARLMPITREVAWLLAEWVGAVPTSGDGAKLVPGTISR